MWQVDKRTERVLLQANGTRAARPTAYRAPTWSWRSVEAKIAYPDGPISNPGCAGDAIHILDAYVEYIEGDLTRELESGHIELRALLRPVSLQWRKGTQDKRTNTLFPNRLTMLDELPDCDNLRRIENPRVIMFEREI